MPTRGVTDVARLPANARRYVQCLEQVSGVRCAIISTGSTASASEMLINGLKPWMDVAVIGDTTYGKPVGMRSHDD